MYKDWGRKKQKREKAIIALTIVSKKWFVVF